MPAPFGGAGQAATCALKTYAKNIGTESLTMRACGSFPTKSAAHRPRQANATGGDWIAAWTCCYYPISACQSGYWLESLSSSEPDEASSYLSLTSRRAAPVLSSTYASQPSENDSLLGSESRGPL